MEAIVTTLARYLPLNLSLLVSVNVRLSDDEARLGRGVPNSGGGRNEIFYDGPN